MSGHFGWIDWSVVAAYFGLVALISHRLRGRQSDVHEYFLGSRSLPWPAVAASIVSTAISGVTFVGVPALVYAQGGDYRYLQFALAGVISKWVLGQFIMPRLYEKQYASPYDYIRDRLGSGVGRVSALLFFVGAVLGQGVRIYAVALVLELLTGLGFEWCVALSIGAAVVSTWLGGVRAVVWTDVLQFVMLVAGGVVAILYVTQGYPGGLGALLEAGSAAGKTRVLDFTADPRLQFTFWAGVFAMPFQNLAAYGTDQLNTQRMLCCRSVREARLALWWSNAGELVVVLFLTVGLALWGYYQSHPVDPVFAGLVAEKGDRIFPAFILSEMPTGLRGFMVAALFAAAMASPVLSALAETTLTMFHDGHRAGSLAPARALWLSRLFVVGWGAVLGVFAVALAGRGEQLVPLAFQMPAYTYGPMLGQFLLALFVPRERIHSIPLAVAVSMLGVLTVDNAARLGWTDGGPLVAFPWLFPLGGLLCLAAAMAPVTPRR